MDTINVIAASMGMDSAEAEQLSTDLVQCIASFCSELDAVAIPGFGTLQPVKSDETVSTDLSTGRRILMPPCIHTDFKCSVVLRKRLNDSKQ